MAVGIRSQGYSDRMGRSRRRTAWLKRALLTIGAMAVVGAGAWALTTFSLFGISDIRVSGAERLGVDRIISTVRASGPHNLLLARTDDIVDLLRQQYPSLEQVRVSKEYPHGLDISLTERQAMGSWCRTIGHDDAEATCQLFDRTGARWGTALPSSGPLLLLVRDERTDDATPEKLFRGLLGTVDGLAKLGLTVKTMSLPDAEPGALYAHVVKGYDVYADGLGDIADQLQVLEVFLADKANPPAGGPAFTPQYIDIRTPGRVYYK